MSLYRRGAIWWCEWQIGGRRIRESTGTADSRAAQEWHDRRRAELWRETRLGERPAQRWDEAALAWISEHAQHKRSYEDDRLRLIWITERLTGLPLTEITTERLVALRTECTAARSVATGNRYLAIVSAVLHYAHTKGALPSVPKIPYQREPEGRLEWLTREDACALCRILPLHLGALAWFSIHTGLRRANATHLEWAHVDAGRAIAWVHADSAKAGKSLAIPLNADARAVLDMQRGLHERWVFPWRGQPITDPGQEAWKRACAAIGRKGFCWHGLRHTWASWHVQAGTPLEVLQKLGGWASLDMVMRYAHLAPGYAAGYADRLSGVAQ